MLKTTLCYVYQEDRVLMIYRNKKKNDFHEGKWNGLGGKFEIGETPLECVRREVYEESGLSIINPSLLGICFFPNFDSEDELMYLYVAHEFQGDLRECLEGELHWINKSDMLKLNVWDSDRIFLPYVFQEQPFTGVFTFEGKRLIHYEIHSTPTEKFNQFLNQISNK